MVADQLFSAKANRALPLSDLLVGVGAREVPAPCGQTLGVVARDGPGHLCGPRWRQAWGIGDAHRRRRHREDQEDLHGGTPHDDQSACQKTDQTW